MATLSSPPKVEVNQAAEARDTLPMALTWRWQTWPGVMRRAVGFLLLTIATCAALLALIHYYKVSIARQWQRETTLKRQAELLLQNSGQERVNIEQNLPLLRSLQEQGIYGETKRVDWIEALRNIEKRWAGISIDYEIGVENLGPAPAVAGRGSNVAGDVLPQVPRQTSTLPSDTSSLNQSSTNRLGRFQTTMTLSMNVLHEGDVFAVLDELTSAGLGHFNVKECALKRISTSAAQPGLSDVSAVNLEPAITAHCVLNWTSFKLYAP